MSDFVLKRSDGTSRKVFGYQYQTPSTRPVLYQANQYKNLPKKVDLRVYMTSVENQEDMGSCTANAVAGAYEYLIKRHQGITNYDVSRLFIYYNARKKVGQEKDDAGSVISYAIESLKEVGACSEKTWNYDKNLLFREPSQQAYAEARQFLVEDTHVVPTNLFSWKHALAEGYPIIFGISLFDSFDKHRLKGLIPMPTPKDVGRGEHGRHAMLCVGYSDIDKIFIVRNSWGTSWGDKGYCYIPYDYVINSNYNLSDSWIIRQIQPISSPEKMWDNSLNSLLTQLDTEFANMGEERFSQMLDEMNDFSLESRLALILLSVAKSDNELSNQEIWGIAEYMQSVLEAIGICIDAYAVLRNVEAYVGNRRLLQESVELFKKHLSFGALSSLALNIIQIAGGDGLKTEEQKFVVDLVRDWLLSNQNNVDTLLEDYDAQFGNFNMAIFDTMVQEMGDITMSERIAIILINFCCVDGKLTQREVEDIALYLEKIFSILQVEVVGVDIVNYAIPYAGNQEIFDETLELLQKYFPPAALMSIVLNGSRIARVSKSNTVQWDWMKCIVSCWQIEDVKMFAILDSLQELSLDYDSEEEEAYEFEQYLEQTEEEDQYSEDIEDDEEGDYEEEQYSEDIEEETVVYEEEQYSQQESQNEDYSQSNFFME